jgi:5-methylcytosine-specific restriction endonuclease McrA
MPGMHARHKKRKIKIKRTYKKKKEKKQTIPKALREQLWVRNCGKEFEHKCYVRWCKNTISVFDFHVGHDKPESKGGTLELDNLKPLCARCNLSMGNKYTIKQWNKMMSVPKQKKRWWCCF